MYRKIVWCYVFVLTLLDVSLNTKLSAQGKSHGVTVHDSLIEGITFQEWGKEAGSAGAGAGGGARRAVAADALALSPAALHFGRAPLAAAHALTVTLTNTANTTMHLASVAGTTPDFHASFFESKTLPPQANTTFSVVYLGRREGPVAAHLYIHTSLGVHKYPVSAVGVASEWGVWPLVGVRVPHNSTAEPELTLYNPTDRPIQVSEVYSSGAWLGLRLPGGGESAPRDAWLLPPRATAPVVRLRLQPPHHHHHALTAYVRIKANITGGGLVVCVEARGAAPGEYVQPWQLRLGARGSRDPALEVDIEAGNSLNAGVALEAAVWGARCAAAPHDPPEPHEPRDPRDPRDPHDAHDAHRTHDPVLANGQGDKGTANGNGAKAGGVGGGGVQVALVRAQLEPLQPLARAALLTLDYAKMWSGYTSGADADADAEGAWCGGWVRVGRARLPYSLRLLPGTLRLLPHELHVVTASREEAMRVRELRVRNEFHVPLHIAHVERPPDIEHHFECEWATPLTLPPGGAATVGRLRLREPAAEPALESRLVLHTNVTRYSLPVLVYGGRLQLEWEWPNSADGELRLGGVGASSTRRVALVVRNPGPAPLCLRELRAALPGAQLALAACAAARAAAASHPCRCVAARGAARAWLTVVAPAREGALRGAVHVAAAAPAPGARAAVSLHVLAGRLHALPVHLPRVAPYAWASAPLVLESTMALRMRVVDVTQPEPDPALSYVPAAEAAAREVGAGRHAVGSLVYAAEKLCEPDCYTGLDLDTPEGAAWERRGAAVTADGLRADAALQAARHARFAALAPALDLALHVHTTHVVQLPVAATARRWWPRLADAAAGDAGLAAVGAERALRVRAANPARARPLLLQAVLHAPPLPLAGGSESRACETEKCVRSAESFRIVAWRATRGWAREWRAGAGGAPEPPPARAAGAPEWRPAPPGGERALPPLLLAPGAEVEFKILFAPEEPLASTAFLYLRNNLTVVEGVQLLGRGAHPSFELGGRRPDTDAPLLFEAGEWSAGGGTVRRTVVARNTGRVAVRLREWRVAGAPCQARGFRLRPCAPLHLAPNESRALHLAYTPDCTLARAAAALQLRTDTGRAAFPLAAATPARLLPACAAARPRPPWEPALRAAGTLLALAALALVLLVAALDAERELRRARAARPPPAPRRPLDLRALARAPPQPPAPPPPVPRRAPARRRRHTPRRGPPALDPHAERRAFERWRAEVLRRPADDADDIEHRPDGPPAADEPAASPPPPGPPEPRRDRSPSPATADGYEADPETEERPPGADDDAASTGSGTPSASSSSSPTTVDRDDRDDGNRDDGDRDDGDRDDVYADDVYADGPEPDPEPPRPETAAGDETPPETAAHGNADRPPAEPAARPARQRRDAGETPRRGERARAADGGDCAARTRSVTAKHHARKDKASKRRGERPASSPPRSPPRAAAAAAALRWGASWSSVVAARAAPAPPRAPAPGPLAPIGSDVRRRAEPEPRAAGDNSLFYFNGDAAHAPCPEPEYWRPPRAPVDGPAFTPARDYMEEPGAVGGGAYRSVGSVWGSTLEPRPPGAGAGATWLWGGAALGEAGEVRPPPGFGAARPARVYDPFRSLAAIWAPGARDWRADPPADRDD